MPLLTELIGTFILELDKAVNLCYCSQAFINETKRIEYLFELYDKYTSEMFGEEKKGKGNLDFIYTSSINNGIHNYNLIPKKSSNEFNKKY